MESLLQGMLKPIKTPSMGERYKQSIEKENRLEAASRLVQKALRAQETTSDSKEKKDKKAKKNSKGRIQRCPHSARELRL